MPLTGVEHTLTEYGAENMTTASFVIFMIVYAATRRECGWRRKRSGISSLADVLSLMDEGFFAYVTSGLTSVTRVTV